MDKVAYSNCFLVFSYKDKIKNNTLTIIGNENISFINDDYKLILDFININKDNLINYKIYLASINQMLPLYKYDHLDVRIEPGAIIRDGVTLNKGCIVLMNAVINVGANIGEDSMIDMGAVIGSGALIGKNCHIGANAVISGVMEPVSNKNVVIEDNCFIGAGSVVLEGVRIKKGSIVGAMSLVNKDVPEDSVVIGIPGKVYKKTDERVKLKCALNPTLR